MNRLSLKGSALAVGFIIGLAGAASALGGDNLQGQSAAVPADVSLSKTTRGVVFFTAAINADGTIASCFNCNSSKTFRLA
jgi:hypothetical protein